MNHSTTASGYFDNIAASAGPSPLGTWLITALRRLMSPSAVTSGPSRREREAAELRVYAASIRATDPRQADDLFAVADRHERLHV